VSWQQQNPFYCKFNTLDRDRWVLGLDTSVTPAVKPTFRKCVSQFYYLFAFSYSKIAILEIKDTTVHKFKLRGYNKTAVAYDWKCRDALQSLFLPHHTFNISHGRIPCQGNRNTYTCQFTVFFNSTQWFRINSEGIRMCR
jgi:hypothetical protein